MRGRPSPVGQVQSRVPPNSQALAVPLSCLPQGLGLAWVAAAGMGCPSGGSCGSEPPFLPTQQLTGIWLPDGCLSPEARDTDASVRGLYSPELGDAAQG